MSLKRISLAAVSLVVVLAVIFGVLWAFPLFRVNTIDVRGAAHLPAEQVREATGLQPEENMLRVDVVAAANGVAGLPWVRSVTVEREWPSTVAVEITERQAVLFSGEPDGTHLIDETGTAFTIADPPPEAVEVTGEGSDDPEVLVEVAEVVDSIDPAVREQIDRVEAPGALEIEFILGDGRTVYWGANEENHDKALAMETVLGQEGQNWNISNPAMVTVR